MLFTVFLRGMNQSGKQPFHTRVLPSIRQRGLSLFYQVEPCSPQNAEDRQSFLYFADAANGLMTEIDRLFVFRSFFRSKRTFRFFICSSVRCLLEEEAMIQSPYLLCDSEQFLKILHYATLPLMSTNTYSLGQPVLSPPIFRKYFCAVTFLTN